MLVAMQFDYNRLKDRRIVYGLLLLTVLLLVAVFAFSPINGARRWIKLQRLFNSTVRSCQNSSLAIFLAYFLEKRAGEEHTFWRTFVPCAAGDRRCWPV